MALSMQRASVLFCLASLLLMVYPDMFALISSQTSRLASGSHWNKTKTELCRWIISFQHAQMENGHPQSETVAKKNKPQITSSATAPSTTSQMLEFGYRIILDLAILACKTKPVNSEPSSAGTSAGSGESEKVPQTGRVISSPKVNQLYDISFKKDEDRRVRITGSAAGFLFGIDFLTASDQIAFHTSVRFRKPGLHIHWNKGKPAVVRNTFDGVWGREEKELVGGFPFALDGPFVIEIFAAKNTNFFDFHVNGVHQFYYAYRIPVEKITKVRLTQEVKCKELQII